jgi:hypothetical protein
MTLVYGGLTIPGAAVLNAVAPARPITAAGARALVPLTYGQDRVNGLILNVLLATTGSSTLLVQVLWGHACSAVGTLQLNERALSGGSSATNYTGSQSTAHAALVTAFAAQGITYTDTLAGYAYSVIAMPVVEFDGQLNFSALIDGRKLYDPRLDSTNGGSGSQRLATPSTWTFSTNPSLALADFLYSNLYGANDPPLWSSVITAANANDALIGSPTETHRKIGVTFTAGVPVPDMAESLRAYAGVWLVPTSGGIKLLPDTTAATSATYNHGSAQIASIAPLTLRDLGNSPTVVEVIYTNVSATPYREASAIASVAGAGTTLPWRQSTVRLPGIQRYGQALREATERLNKLTLSDLSTSVDVFDVGIAHEPGDVVGITHPVGLLNKLFRVAAPPEMSGPGRWRLALVEYDPAVYSTLVATGPTYTDSGFNVSGALDPAWSTITGRPTLLRVSARGLSATTYPIDAGFRNGETGANVFGASIVRSYMMSRIRRSDGVITHSRQYDVYGVGEVGGYTAATLAADLNATDSSYIVVVFTFDEPLTNRLTSGLPDALYRCGASRAIFGSPNFALRAAYLLIGIGGCGEGNGFEQYAGSVSSDPNAWCDVSFYLQNGNLVISGTTATPRTLTDYSYVGDLNATFGATWGVNIGGSNKPADNATVGATWGVNIGGSGLPEDYANAGGVAGYVNTDPNLWRPDEWSKSSAVNYAANAYVATGWMAAFYDSDGVPCDILSREFPVNHRRTYILESAVWKSSGAACTHYLLVAFYDANNALLNGSSYGTGWPSGGTFHYFGLINGMPAYDGANVYSIAFGANATAKIPDTAVYAKVGILANYNGGSGTWYYAGSRVRLMSDTEAIEPQAVTIPVCAYTEGNYGSIANATWGTVQSTTFTSSGAPCSVQGSAHVTHYILGNTNGYLYWRLQRDGSTIFTAVMTGPPSIELLVTSGMIQDTPGAGSHTYDFQVMVNGGSYYTYAVKNRSLFVLETKR